MNPPGHVFVYALNIATIGGTALTLVAQRDHEER
jgi:hypothetical protein